MQAESVAATEPPTRRGEGPSRRAVTAAAVWAVPAIGLASAAPAAAVSPEPNSITVAFTQEVYDVRANSSLTNVAVLVQKVAQSSSPGAGASVSFVISEVPDGTDLPDDVDEDAIDASEGVGAGEITLTFPGGSANATNISDGSGYCGTPAITSGSGYGVLQITATATLGRYSASAVAYIRVQLTGHLWSWGKADHGALGNGSKKTQPIPALVSYTATNVVDIQLSRKAHGGTLLTNAGEIYTWGYGCYGLNGQGDARNTKSYYTPVKVNSTKKFKSLASGYYNVGAVTTDGAAYAWGKNYASVSLPAGKRNDKIYTPTLIHPSLSSGVKQLSLSKYNGLALKEDGTVWTWGYNYGYYGLGLGAGKPAYVLVPTQITFPAGTGKIVHIQAGWASGYAVDEHGNMWGWGGGHYYRLGNGTTKNYNAPVRINAVGDTGYVRINHFSYPGRSAVAVKADGTAMYWGYNGHGNSGNGTTGYVKTPTNIGITNIARALAAPQTTHLVRKDGTIWSAGSGGCGQLGDGSKKSKRAWTKALLPATSKALLVGANEYTVFALTDR
ncbi:RCC1 domain-containing protein [Klugiella xanthotipulae]|uniref:Regulator of chromosome condensation (RCC1) repeat-containing protein n=1 Tax=Klugiella xanthotipulae TaxID=244735 RepID=A0A543HY96_9MICO|nr:hypothetical protein [Klugiella xanthotipulae]TQM63327.1 regulator of chromosome condensation (RCC1) repeat-containing protein [Klugiella xanthotipulae]